MNTSERRSSGAPGTPDCLAFHAGFQWFTHFPSVIKFKEPWLYDPEFADLWPGLDHFKVIDQPDYEPPNYNYTNHYKEAQQAQFKDDILNAKVSKHIESYVQTAVDRNYSSLSWLNCSSPKHSAFTVCNPSKTPGLDGKRAIKYDVIKHIAETLHQIIEVDGHHDFCDVDAAGVRTGDPAVFLNKLKFKDINGFSGYRKWSPIGVVDGEVLTLPPTFMLNDWRPTEGASGKKYTSQKTCDMHVNKFSTESDPTDVKVMKRDFVTGAPVATIQWMGNTTRSPRNWYPGMCGKSMRVDKSRVDKHCVPCPSGYFNPPLDGVEECVPISTYVCKPGTYLVEKLATGVGLELPCMACSAGTYAAGDTTVLACVACPKGRYSSDTRSSACAACEGSLTTSNPGSVSPQACLCGIGAYHTSPATCAPCPNGSTTTSLGSSSMSACLCDKGAYLPKSLGACAPCKDAMDCPRGSSEANFEAHLAGAALSKEQKFPMLMKGFWSLPEEPLSVFRC